MFQLKLESLRQRLPLILICLFASFVFLQSADLSVYFRTPLNLRELPREALEGAYVTAEIDYIYGCYAYSEVYENGAYTGQIFQREYLIDANEENYLCLILEGEDMEKAEQLLQTGDSSHAFTVTGYVRPLSIDSEISLHRAVDYYTMPQEEKDVYLPLSLSPVDMGTNTVMVFLVALSLAYAVYYSGQSFAEGNLRNLKDTLQNLYGDNKAAGKDLLRYLLSLPQTNGLRIGRGYLLCRANGSHHLLTQQDLVWAYLQTTPRKAYGFIPMGNAHALVLCTYRGQRLIIPMTEQEVTRNMQYLKRYFPNTLRGYSEALNNRFNANPASFRHS